MFFAAILCGDCDFYVEYAEISVIICIAEIARNSRMAPFVVSNFLM